MAKKAETGKVAKKAESLPGRARSSSSKKDPAAGTPSPYPANLLVVFDDALSSTYLFEKAALLAGPDTRVHVVQVVYEGIADISVSAIDHSAGLKTFLLESAESVLEEQLFKVRDQLPNLESATLWNSRDWEGVLHAAEAVEADMILKAADEHQTSGISTIVRTPSEWNLLRHATAPVMLVKPQVWPENALLLCALDVFDDTHEELNLRLLRRAADLAATLAADLDLICAYPLFEPWVGELGAVKSYAEIKDAVEKDIRDRVEKLVRRSGIGYRHLLLDEGQAAHVISRIAEDTEAALLIVGTHAREGVLGVLLGNTSERILHAVDTDVLTVPLVSGSGKLKTKEKKKKKKKKKKTAGKKQSSAGKKSAKPAPKKGRPKKRSVRQPAVKKSTATRREASKLELSKKRTKAGKKPKKR